MSIVYYHLNLIDSTAGCCCCHCFSLQGAESLANTIYSLLCPLNTSFRPSPLRFSAHTYFFSSWTSLQNPLQRMCKNGCNEPTQVIYVDIRRDNDALLKDSEVFHILSQFCRRTLKGFKMYFLSYKLYYISQKSHSNMVYVRRSHCVELPESPWLNVSLYKHRRECKYLRKLNSFH